MILLTSRRKGGDLLAFGPDSRMLAARSESGLQVWTDVTSGAKAKVYRDLISIASIQFTPDGKHLVFDGSRSGVIDLTDGGVSFFPDPDGYRFSSLRSDGRFLLSVHLPQDRSNRIECWPFMPAHPVRRPLWKVRLKRWFGGRPIALPDGGFVLQEGEKADGSRERWFCYVVRSGQNGRALGESVHLDWVSERDAVSPDGKWIVGQHTNELRIWSLEELEKPPLERKNDSRKIFTDVAFHPSGCWLGVSGNDGTVKMFDTSTWHVAHTYSWGVGKMVGLAFSPDGTLAAAGSDKGRIVIWDVEA